MITEAAIKSAIFTATRIKKTVEMKDGGERGVGRLVLAVRPFENEEGAVSRVTTEWYAYSYRGGSKTSAKLGTYPTLALGAARKLFREKFAPTISSGASLVGMRAKAAAVNRDATLGALFGSYLKYLEGKRSHRAAKYHLAAAEKYLGKDKLAASLTTEDFSEYLGIIHDRDAIVSAASARAYIHAAFQRAIKGEHDYTKRGEVKSWGIAFNPLSQIPTDPNALRTGKRHLAPAEWATLFRWLGESPNVLAPSLQINMLTGQRLLEILLLLKPQYDRANAMLDWETTKNKLPHSIPLPRQATPIMDELVKNKRDRLFPCGDEINMQNAYYVMRTLILEFLEEHQDIPHFTGRDVRRTWKTLAGAAGISKEMRDRLQNHARGDVGSKHYDRWEALPEKRAAMEQWAEYIDLMLSGDLDKMSETRGQPISLAEARARMKKMAG